MPLLLFGYCSSSRSAIRFNSASGRSALMQRRAFVRRRGLYSSRCARRQQAHSQRQQLKGLSAGLNVRRPRPAACRIADAPTVLPLARTVVLARDEAELCGQYPRVRRPGHDAAAERPYTSSHSIRSELRSPGIDAVGCMPLLGVGVSECKSDDGNDKTQRRKQPRIPKGKRRVVHLLEEPD